MIIERTKDALRKKGTRATRHRLAVAGIMAESKTPMGVKDVFEHMVRQDPQIGLATVYRVMSVLEEAGVIKRQPNLTGVTAHYQLSSAESGQVVCSRCGKVEAISQFPGLEELRRNVVSQSKFATSDQSLYIIADCRNEECD